MEFTISGFGGVQEEKKATAAYEETNRTIVPRKSIVRVKFPGRGMALAYYNDQFDLRPGNLVYVDGKLEGELGRVVEVGYNFKIKLSDYKKVIALADTDVSGQLFMAGAHFVTFDRNVLPAQKVALWFHPPIKEEDEYVTGSDDSSFRLDSLKDMGITEAIAERGHNYYMENKVRYLCLDGGRGYAIVQGSKAYTVELFYDDGEISNLTCDCPCSCNCKHEFAVMLQLREILAWMEKYRSEAYAHTGYFAAITKGTLFDFAIGGKETGSVTL